MRLALIGLATMAAAVAADMQGASAQNESFFQKRYRARRGGIPSQLSCSYDTLKQCDNVFEPTRYCMENPWWHGPRQQPRTQGKKGRRNRSGWLADLLAYEAHFITMCRSG
jgi:hypothetical protein